MKKNSFTIMSLLCVATTFAIFLNSYAWATMSSKPVVIRKKIVAQNQNDLKNPGDVTIAKVARELKPKSDISVIFEADAQKHIEVADTKSGKHVLPMYDPKDKIDPFEPLFKETPDIKSGFPQYADTKGNTPLEEIDLSQLKLTGIILAASGNRALVREASGLGHIISKGTPIGTHGGRVAVVLKDKVIVKERMKDDRERYFFQNTELKLNKPDS